MTTPPVLFARLSEFADLQRAHKQGSARMYTARHRPTGHAYYVKEVVKGKGKGKGEGGGPRDRNDFGVRDVELAANEFLASVLYAYVYEVPAIRLAFVVNDCDVRMQRYLLASRAMDIDTCETSTPACDALYRNAVPGTMEPFLVDCVMANWDVGSVGNVGVVRDRGKADTGAWRAFRIDVGGSLLYRALGRPRDFARVPVEHDTFFDPTAKSRRLFGALRADQLGAAYDVLAAVPPRRFALARDWLARALRRRIPDADDARAAAAVVDRAMDALVARHDFYLRGRRAVLASLRARTAQEKKI